MQSNRTPSSSPRSRRPDPALRNRVYRRDDWRCVYCRERPPYRDLQVDHVIPYSRGGLTVIENLVTSCRECNYTKRAKFLPLQVLATVAPHLDANPHYAEVGRICRKCGEVIEYEGDNLCTCRKRTEPRCECGELLGSDDDEMCDGCYSRRYIYCRECGEEEQLPDGIYCATCEAEQ